MDKTFRFINNSNYDIYGSEIWISEFKINFNVIDKLLLEKNKNMIFKNILSNLAIQTELGYYPICIKSYKLMFKYYSRLVDIESNCDSKFNLLRATFIEDKNLYNNKHLS